MLGLLRSSALKLGAWSASCGELRRFGVERTGDGGWARPSDDSDRFTVVRCRGRRISTGSKRDRVAKRTPLPPRPSITTYPIQVVQTADGAVSYRSDGSGSPLVMITGFGAGQDSWPPSLVNALAAVHRVIIFDNAGIGQTTMPPGTLTISAMAAQTNAFIQALGLGRPAVLGWSMGGLIAQALAHLYPDDVSRLVLCATMPGNGTAVGPSTSLLSELLNGVSTDNLGKLMPLLFPSDQVSTQGPAYVAALLKYPGFYGASTPVADAQLSAVESWIAGMDSGGNGIITAPTLIGDGADDVLTAPVNSKELHKSLRSKAHDLPGRRSRLRLRGRRTSGQNMSTSSCDKRH